MLDEIVEALADEAIRYEILVVDDASTDGTAELAEQFARDCWQCPVRVIRCPERRGAGAARKVGIRHARGEIVVMLDADGTYPAESSRSCSATFPAYDQVNGARTSEQGTLPWLRRPAKWFIRKLACYLTGHKIPDLNTGLKAFKREVDAALAVGRARRLQLRDHHDPGLSDQRLRGEVRAHAYRPRIGRSKFHPIKDTLLYLSTVLRMVLYFRPLKVFLPLAGLVIAAGACSRACSSFALTGSMQESDIVVLTAGFMTCMLGPAGRGDRGSSPPLGSTGSACSAASTRSRIIPMAGSSSLAAPHRRSRRWR